MSEKRKFTPEEIEAAFQEWLKQCPVGDGITLLVMNHETPIEALVDVIEDNIPDSYGVPEYEGASRLSDDPLDTTTWKGSLEEHERRFNASEADPEFEPEPNFLYWRVEHEDRDGSLSTWYMKTNEASPEPRYLGKCTEITREEYERIQHIGEDQS